MTRKLQMIKMIKTNKKFHCQMVTGVIFFRKNLFFNNLLFEKAQRGFKKALETLIKYKKRHKIEWAQKRVFFFIIGGFSIKFEEFFYRNGYSSKHDFIYPQMVMIMKTMAVTIII